MSGKCFYPSFKILFTFKSLVISKMPYYAVARGRVQGIFMNWADCESQVKGFPGARYKKFNTAVDAEKFILSVDGSSGTQKNKAVVNEKKMNKSTNIQHKSANTLENRKSVKPAKKRLLKISENNIGSDEDDDLITFLNTKMDDIEKRIKLIDPPQAKKRKSGKFDFIEDENGFVQVYTDGACSSNGKNSARAGIGVFWDNGHPLNLSEPVTGRATNNCGEIQAATAAIKLALQNGIKKLTINTDSQFLINSVTKWMAGWKRKGWKLKSGEPVKNEKDFKELDEVQNQLQVKWSYVEAHRGVHGNEMADQLAKAGAALYSKD